MKGSCSIQGIKGVRCANKEHRINVVGVKYAAHCMDSCLAATFVSCANLQGVARVDHDLFGHAHHTRVVHHEMQPFDLGVH